MIARARPPRGDLNRGDEKARPLSRDELILDCLALPALFLVLWLIGSALQ